MKKLRLLYMVLTTLLVTQWAFAQTFTVGTCSTGIGSNTYGPMNSITTAGGKNRTAFIIPASQLGAIANGTITSTFFKRVSTTGSMTPGNQTFSIYLQNTTATDFGSATLVWATAIANATQVYSGDPATAVGSSAGMKEFVHTTNFLYTSGSNLAVFVEYSQTAGQTSIITWDYEYGSPCIDTSNSNTTKYTNTTGTLGDLTNSNYRRPVTGFNVTLPPPTSPPACTTVTSPANAATAQSVTPTISWAAPIGQATGYYLNIGTTPGGNDVINNQDVGNVTSYTIPAASPLAYSTTYYVTIVPYNALGSASGCSSSSFTTRAIPCPTVNAPASNSGGVPLTPTFSWTAVTGATGYKISIGTSTAATDVLNNQDVGNVTSYTLVTPLNPNTKYYYTVTAYSASSTSASCTERTFTTICTTAIDLAAQPSATWTENFDSMATIGAGVVPSCWAAVAGTKNWSSMNTATTSYNAPRSAPNYMTIAYGNTVASQLWTPGFNLVAGETYEFSFYYNTKNTTSSYIGYTGDVQVNTTTSLTGATNLGTFITATQGTTAYTLYSVNFTPAATGVYYFAVNVSSTSAPWYLGVDDFKLMKTTALATAEVNAKKAGEAVYPNPFTEFVDISEVKNAKSATVIDAAGRTVATFEKVDRRIDLAHLSSGMYILSVTKKDGTTSSFKIMKK